MLKHFRPAPHIARLPKERIDPTYKKLRIQVFAGILIGYASFYLLRNNFSLAIPYLEQTGFSKVQCAFVFSAYPIAYGISKFFMGILSDRSNPRYFMATGLILTSLIGFAFGNDFVLNKLALMTVLMFINGWVQGMGWPASARVMAHWFSSKERGTKMSIWSTAQNIGGGLIAPLATLGIIIFSSWHSIFYFPAMFTLTAAIVVLVLVRDTPQSEGLPPIEEHRNESPAIKVGKKESHEKELTTKEILFKYVLVNKYLWYLAVANVFAYLVRYGVINWTPSYLTQVKEFTPNASRVAYFLFEYAAIPGIILCGWLSDKIFRSQRTQICVIYMIAVTAGVLFYWLMPAGHPLCNIIALVTIGFFIYGPVSLIGINAVDLVPKKAAGTAAGLTGLLGYVIGATSANMVIGGVVQHFGWNGGFITILASCILTIVFLVLSRQPKVEEVMESAQLKAEEELEPESA